ncbi:hypothetical protein Bhyg_00461 [Pseudolycoriella hygida]|uniref:Uncharacterized protein n=1 Tax=Pseudolycoriella hygida TaxID=35572 RepID=A0A9Q0N7L1_9DIPT|nr:hypothetical protein Bhyg_00461 [Pseudolycoriella hygida]
MVLIDMKQKRSSTHGNQ